MSSGFNKKTIVVVGGFRLLNFFKLSPLWLEQYEIADLNYVLDLSKIKNKLDWSPASFRPVL